MRQWIFRWKKFIMIGLLTVVFFGGNLKAQAAGKAVLLIEGVMETDVVMLYKIASYDESSQTYEWTEPVRTWITEKNTTYMDLTPQRFQRLPEKRALEFSSLLLTGLQTSAAGVIPDVEETGQTEYEIHIDPGIYLILPIGSTRVYSLKCFEALPLNDLTDTVDIFYRGADQLSDMTEADIDYDYDIPTIEVSFENLMEERNFENEEEIDQEGSQKDEIKDQEEKKPTSIFTIENDQVQVSTKVLIPTFPSVYATEKRITNLYVAIPQGIQYIPDSLELSFPAEEESEEDNQTDTSRYVLQSLENASIYEYKGQQIFFKLGDWYYYPDGNTLMTDVTDAEAFRTYLISKGLLNEKKETDTETEGEQEAEPTVEDLVITDNWTIFIFSFNTDEEWKEVNVSYRVAKNDESNQTGIYPLKTALLFSVSPLNTSIRGYIENTAEIDSYGINITVIKGTSFSKYSSMEELLEKEERLTNVEFGVYRFTGKKIKEITDEVLVNEGDLDIHNGEEAETEAEADESPKNEDVSGNLERILYKLHEDGTYHEYELKKVVSPDEDGVVRLGGLSKEEYLIRETKFPTGFTYASETFLIEQTDWDEEKLMEGNHVAALVWLNFPTAYLPATGKEGIGKYVSAGVMIGMIALTGMMIMLIREVKSLKKLIKERDNYLKQKEIEKNVNETEKGEIL